jgi:hypothetical protein
VLVVVATIALLRPASIVEVHAGESLQTELAGAPPGSTVVLSGGAYEGPIVIDKPLTLRGTGVALVTAALSDVAAIKVTSDHVVLEDLSVVGGDSGIIVRGVEDVLLRGVSVEGAELHGIEIVDASARIEDAFVGGLRNAMAQGIEIRNSDGRPDSVVTGSVIRGGQEGIVSHVSEVVVQDNLVEASTMRGIAITEMSDGIVSGNEIRDAVGSALYCGDMSRCQFEDNTSDMVAASGLGRSGEGWGLVVTYHAAASSKQDQVAGVAGRVFTSLGGRVQNSTPLEIGAGWSALPSILLATAAALSALAAMFMASKPLARKLQASALSPGGAWIFLAVIPLVAVQTFHMFEHTLQVFRVRVDGVPSRGGIVGPVVEGEWIHFVYNVAVLLLLVVILFARRKGWSPTNRPRLGDRFLVAGALVQGYHAIEHSVKLIQHHVTGSKVNEGLAGGVFDLVLLHYAMNLTVYLALLGAIAAWSWPFLSSKMAFSTISLEKKALRPPTPT